MRLRPPPSTAPPNRGSSFIIPGFRASEKWFFNPWLEEPLNFSFFQKIARRMSCLPDHPDFLAFQENPRRSGLSLFNFPTHLNHGNRFPGLPLPDSSLERTDLNFSSLTADLVSPRSNLLSPSRPIGLFFLTGFRAPNCSDVVALQSPTRENDP